MFRRFMAMAVVLFSTVSFGLFAANPVGNKDAGKTLSTACVACHNADGNSTNPIWPKIAGQNESYLYKQLQELRKGSTRSGPLMLGIIADMTDQQFADLAVFFAQEKMTPGETDAALKELGEKIYRNGLPEKGVTACTSCHGPEGTGNFAAMYPRVSGQHAEYTVLQLQAFRGDARRNDPNGMMRSIAKRMSDDDMKAVASYMSGLH